MPDLDLGLCVRTTGDPAGFANTLRRTVRDLDPRVELLDTTLLAAHSGMVLFPQRMASSLLLLLGLFLKLRADRRKAREAVYARQLEAYDDKRNQETRGRIWVGENDKTVER